MKRITDLPRRPIERAANVVHKVGLVDLGLIVSAYFCYAIVRASAGNAHLEARSRAYDVISVEQTLGVFWEEPMQDLVMGSESLIKFFNAFYAYGHFPVIFAVGLWLFVFHRRRYVLVRNAFLISGALSLVVFHLFPLAPPRLLPAHYGFVDTLGQFSDVNYHSGGNFVNNYAAMPSLHIGWNLLLAIGIVTTIKNPLVRLPAVLMPALMSITVVVTGNHYFLDIAGGVMVAMVGLFFAIQLDRHGWKAKRLILGPGNDAHPSLV